MDTTYGSPIYVDDHHLHLAGHRPGASAGSPDSSSRPAANASAGSGRPAASSEASSGSASTPSRPASPSAHYAAQTELAPMPDPGGCTFGSDYRTCRRRAGRGRHDVASRAMSERTPVAPYMAVGLSTIVHGVAERRHIAAQPRHHRGRHPRGGRDHRHQHAGQADRARRGRPHRLHRRDLRHPARHGGARAVHRHPRRRRASGWPSSRGCTRPTSSCSARRAGPRSCPTASSTRCS